MIQLPPPATTTTTKEGEYPRYKLVRYLPAPPGPAILHVRPLHVPPWLMPLLPHARKRRAAFHPTTFPACDDESGTTISDELYQVLPRPRRFSIKGAQLIYKGRHIFT